MGPFFRRVRYWVRHRRLEADLAEELQFHQEMKQRQLEEEGLARDEAAFAARRGIGNLALAREDARAVWVGPWLESVGQDTVYAIRSLRRQPGFAATAILTLGIGIGLNTSVATIFTTMFWRQWAVTNPGEVVQVMTRDSRRISYEFQYRPPPGLRQCRQSAARADTRARPGDCGSRLPGGEPIAAAPSTADREPRPRRRRSVGWRLDRVSGAGVVPRSSTAVV